MNNLIQITRSNINGVDVNSVNARDLHTALEIKRDFNAWMSDTKEILDTYEEGVDYIRTALDRNNSIVVVKKSLNLQGKQADYIMTLDMCKHISMMSRSDKGREVRKYFIEVEKQSQKVLTISEQIQLIAQGNQIIDERLTILEKTKKLEYWQEKALQDAKNQTVYRIAAGDPDLTKKLHVKVWSLFKKQFFLPRYNELPAVKFEDGKSYLLNLTFADMV